MASKKKKYYKMREPKEIFDPILLEKDPKTGWLKQVMEEEGKNPGKPSAAALAKSGPISKAPNPVSNQGTKPVPTNTTTKAITNAPTKTPNQGPTNANAPTIKPITKAPNPAPTKAITNAPINAPNPASSPEPTKASSPEPTNAPIPEINPESSQGPNLESNPAPIPEPIPELTPEEIALTTDAAEITTLAEELTQSATTSAANVSAANVSAANPSPSAESTKELENKIENIVEKTETLTSRLNKSADKKKKANSGTKAQAPTVAQIETQSQIAEVVSGTQIMNNLNQEIQNLSPKNKNNNAQIIAAQALSVAATAKQIINTPNKTNPAEVTALFVALAPQLEQTVITEARQNVKGNPALNADIVEAEKKMNEPSQPVAIPPSSTDELTDEDFVWYWFISVVFTVIDNQIYLIEKAEKAKTFFNPQTKKIKEFMKKTEDTILLFMDNFKNQTKPDSYRTIIMKINEQIKNIIEKSDKKGKRIEEIGKNNISNTVQRIKNHKELFIFLQEKQSSVQEKINKFNRPLVKENNAIFQRKSEYKEIVAFLEQLYSYHYNLIEANIGNPRNNRYILLFSGETPISGGSPYFGLNPSEDIKKFMKKKVQDFLIHAKVNYDTRYNEDDIIKKQDGYLKDYLNILRPAVKLNEGEQAAYYTESLDSYEASRGHGRPANRDAIKSVTIEYKWDPSVKTLNIIYTFSDGNPILDEHINNELVSPPLVGKYIKDYKIGDTLEYSYLGTMEIEISMRNDVYEYKDVTKIEKGTIVNINNNNYTLVTNRENYDGKKVDMFVTFTKQGNLFTSTDSNLRDFKILSRISTYYVAPDKSGAVKSGGKKRTIKKYRKNKRKTRGKKTGGKKKKHTRKERKVSNYKKTKKYLVRL